MKPATQPADAVVHGGAVLITQLPDVCIRVHDHSGEILRVHRDPVLSGYVEDGGKELTARLTQYRTAEQEGKQGREANLHS